jgi:hypothetical protein
MKSFVKSQVESFPDGSIAVTHRPDNNGHTHTVQHFAGHTNRPINMDMVYTFSSMSVKADEHIAYPAIKFERRDGSTLWYYQPDKDGEARRDADLAYITDVFCVVCPQDNPRALR